MSASNYRFLIVGIVLFSVVAVHGQNTKKEKLRQYIAELGRAYSRMIQQNDVDGISKILADDYLVADEEGKVLTKSEDLASYADKKLRLQITGVEYIDQNVRLITDNVAIDHATIRFIGTSNGKPFDIVERCTTTWANRKGKWLIVADHFSVRPAKK